ncbi:MAG: FAD-binding oxidoreductase [Flavobacteriaceae bacterium]|nr:FAD-binding oxidoreductase [Flavobacteriaceae bacterium]
MSHPNIDELLAKIPGSLTAHETQSRFSHIWKTDEPLHCKGVVFPRTTKQVSTIMQWCYKNDQEVVVHGGLTNLVGGTQTQADQLVVSLEKMNRVHAVDPKNRTVTAEAGAILENVLEAAEKQDLFLPLSFGARGSAQVGGVISTNAGGLRVFRYGMTRNWILGLEVVLPNGTIIENLKTLRKDNSGIDLKHLFIGAEGILGIVTKAVFRLIEKPQTRHSAILTTNDFSNLLQTLRYFDQTLGARLTGFELLWENTYSTITAEETHYKSPIQKPDNYVIFVEMLGKNVERDSNDLQDACAHSFEHEWISDAAFFDSASEQEECWKIREDVATLEAHAPHNQHFDISIPIDQIGTIINNTIQQLLSLDGVLGVYPFGHVADGNMHLIVGKQNDSPKLTQQINEIVYQPLAEVKGSISAEHGIGLDKKPYLHLSRSQEEIHIMKGLKQLFDPKNILNPGRIVD